MASNITETLGHEVDQIAASYEASFAGQSRATRNLDELDRLIARTRAVLAKVMEVPEAAQNPDVARLKDVAETNLDIYEKEKLAIQDAKLAGPDFEEFARLASFANFAFARYFRHFAGKDRASRDLNLLGEMTDDLKQTRQRMAAIVARSGSQSFGRDVELIARNIEMYQGEIKEITAAQASGTLDERASLLALLANGQFDLYRVHFANQSRVTRRPALLQRVVTALRKVREGMASLKKAGFTAEFNDKNFEIVDANLKTYDEELARIRADRQKTPMGDIMGMLGGTANQIFEEYRSSFAGKDRNQVDLAQLGSICDRLHEIARQMLDLGRAEANEMNDKNLDVVVNQLAMYETEYEAVHKAQAALAAAAPTEPTP